MTEMVSMCCGNCGIEFHVPKNWNDVKRKDRTSWFCPNGHERHYVAETEEDKLRKERDRLKQNTAYLEDRNRQLSEARETAERRASAARGQVTKLKNRAANGVCPCCNRTFPNLARHMATKHAGFVAEEVQAEVGRTIQ